LSYGGCELANFGISLNEAFEQSTQFAGGVPATVQLYEAGSADEARRDDTEIAKCNDGVLHRNEMLVEERRDLARIGGLDENQQLQYPLAETRAEKSV